MKRFIIISMLATMVADALACAVPATHNYYLFSVVEQQDWSREANARTMDNWRAYAGKDNLYWFDADELKKVARQKNDVLMESYISQLEKYLEVAEKARETWEYPTKQELARRRTVLQGVQQYALSKTKTRLRSQHALLYMRCNMMLGQHEQNVKFWEQTAQKFINSVYRDMMRNIYAGALLKAGRTDEATQIFAEQCDVSSLYTYYYKKRSYEAIRAEYERNPNSPALPFLLQDFANNAQEAIDALDDGNLPGKLFVRDIKQREARQMEQLARQAVVEGKTQNPALWQSLGAWLQYLFGDKQQALSQIEQAVQLEGRPRIKDNARALRLFITASCHKPGKSLDNFLADELAWLEQRAREERKDSTFYENHYTRVYDRLVHQVLQPAYEKAGRSDVAIAFLAVYDEQPKVFAMLQRQALPATRRRNTPGEWNMDYSGDFFWHIDTIDVAQVERYLAYTRQKPGTPLDRWLSARLRHDDEFLHELLGTKYLRLARWKEAERHLAQVSTAFVDGMNIAPFMAQRNYRTEPWLNRQRIKTERQMPGAAHTKENQKLLFVRDMMALEQGMSTLKAELQPQRAYDLAVRYAQASYAGDAWYLTRYGKSILDEPRADEADFLGRADKLLQQALATTSPQLQELSLFAQAWLPIDSWYKEEWNSQKLDYDLVRLPDSRQYKALQALADFEQSHATNASPYVSKCDVLKEFLKK